ncbi:MAG: glycosyltransferase family 4 protein [Gammaproteobacteria bacterium]
MKRPRTLFVAPRLPFPLNNGTKIRVNHLLRALTEISDVDFVCFGLPWEYAFVSDSRSELPDWWYSLRSGQMLPFPDWQVDDARRYRRLAVRRFFARTDGFYDGFPTDVLKERVSTLIGQADLIWAERLYIARAFLACGSDKTIVDLDDLESAKVRRDAEAGAAGLGRAALIREAARLACTERGAVRQFAGLAVCSPEDAANFDTGTGRVWVVPNGVDDSMMYRPAIARLPHRLVFVGTLNYWPNEQAMLYFHREILPQVRARIPDLSMAIVGLKPPASIRSLHDGQSIFVHADVPDITPYVQQAAASIVPLQIGGGTRLKILESLALGTPVVSTSIGAEGLNLEHARHLLLADDPGEFATAVIRVLEDTEYSRLLARQGHARVEETYLWSSIRRHVQERCMSLLDARRART